jgi:hypothetical protein
MRKIRIHESYATTTKGGYSGKNYRGQRTSDVMEA